MAVTEQREVVTGRFTTARTAGIKSTKAPSVRTAGTT